MGPVTGSRWRTRPRVDSWSRSRSPIASATCPLQPPSPVDRIRALIVDDEPLARSRVRELLATQPDVEVAGECGNGREAIAAIRSGRPDLVYLDVQMPEVTGFEVLEALEPAAAPA